MIIKENNPKQAIITSYNRPVLYNKIVLYKGSRLIRFRLFLYLSMKKLLLLLLFIGCNFTPSKQKVENIEKADKIEEVDYYYDATSSKEDIALYDLKEVSFRAKPTTAFALQPRRDDDGATIFFNIPKDFIENKELYDKPFSIALGSKTLSNVIKTYHSINERFIFQISTISSFNTINNSNKDYIKLYQKRIENQKNFTETLENLAGNRFKEVKVLEHDFDLKIDSNYYVKRVLHFKDARLLRLELTDEQVEVYKDIVGWWSDYMVTEWDYLTIFNKRLYSIKISYYSNLEESGKIKDIAETIAGSVKFIK